MVLFSWHINLTRFQGFLLFTPRLGEMVANLTTIFFHKCVGFNHQLVSDVYGSAFFGTSLESTASHRQFRPKLGLQETYTGNLPFLGSEKDLRNGRERKDLAWMAQMGGRFWQLSGRLWTVKWKIGVFLVKVFFPLRQWFKQPKR